MRARPGPPTRKAQASRERGTAAPLDAILGVLARSADGVFAVDAKQRVVFWDTVAEELLGRPASKAMGKLCYEIVLGRDYQGHPFCRRNCPVIKAARQGRGVPNYDIACRKNGEELWLNVSIVPVPRTAARSPVAIHLVRDISARRRSERLAQSAVETVAQFLSESYGAEIGPGPYPAPDPSLTAREIEVLRLLADGLGTEAQARKLGLSTATVRNHIQRLLAKLGVHSRLGAVVYAARHGLI